MNIVITGTSRGIGKELVEKFAINPENKILAISRNSDIFESLASKYTNIIPLTFQLEKIFSKAKKDIIEKIEKDLKTVDILINNAGILINKSFEETSIEEAEKMFRVNFFAGAELIKILIPYFKNKHRHVVNIGSMGGFQGSAKFPGLSLYSASKAAIASLTESLAVEYQSEKIIFNCLALGAVQTEMLQNAFPEYKAGVSASEIAEFIIEFSTNGTKYFNGKVLPVAISTP